MTVDHFDAQARLKELLGLGGVWLAGLYMDDADSHESAVRSAVTIAANSRRIPRGCGCSSHRARKRPLPSRSLKKGQWLRRASIP